MRITCPTCTGTGEVIDRRFTTGGPACGWSPDYDAHTCGDCRGEGEREETTDERERRLALTVRVPARCPDCGGRLTLRHSPEGDPMGWCDLDGPFEPTLALPVATRQLRLTF